MRVVHVLWSLDPQCGGPVEALRHLVREQVQMLHYDVSILATTMQMRGTRVDREQFERELRQDSMLAGAEIHLMKAYGKRRPWYHYAYSPAGGRWLHERLSDRARRPYVIHIHGTWGHLLSAAAARARRAGIPYALRPSGSLGGVSLAHGHWLLKRLYFHLSLAQDLRRAGFIHVTSQREADELSPLISHDLISVVPHGVEMPPENLSPLAGRFYQRFPRLRDKELVMFLGRLHAVKRIPALVEAVARLRPRRPDLTLLLVGQDDGALAAINETAHRLDIGDAVVHAGFLRGEEKTGAFAAAKVAALPSKHENFGIAAVEAMAHGVPVVVAPEVAAHVYVDRSGGGRTVEGGPEAIAGAIEHILDGRAEQMGRLGREYVREHLSWRAAAERLDELYRSIVTEKYCKQCG